MRAVDLLIQHFDGQTNTAAKLGVKQPTVSGWVTGRHGMSEGTALKAEKLTGGKVKAVALCPRLADVLG